MKFSLVDFNSPRIHTLFLGVCFLFIVLGLSLLKAQVFSHDQFLKLSSKNRIRRVLVEAPRGQILDRYGNILADNRPRFDLVLIREELPKKKKEYVEFLSTFLDVTQKKLWKTLQKTAYLPYKPAVLLQDIDLNLVAKIEERNQDLPGVHVRVEPSRFYLYGEETSHLIGAVGKIPKKEVEMWKERGVRTQETIGRSGIERILDSHLRGKVGGMQVQVNNRGYLDKIIGSRESIPGKDLVLSIEAPLQQHLSEQLKGRKGAGVVMNVRTGEILACVSQPSFDSNILSSGANRKVIQSYFQDQGRPLYSRYNLGLYSPGSLFKLVVALAYMQENPKTWKEKHVFCDGVFNLGSFQFRCWKRSGHGSLSLLDSIKVSCNLFFYETGLELGAEPIAEMASRFGFGQKTGFLLAEKSGLVPTPKWKKKKYKQGWYGGDTANFSIGQGALLCTPLQMAVFISALANEGSILSPVLVAGGKSKEKDLNDLRPFISALKEGMRRVVQDQGGTASKAWVKEMPAAGKTGTVEVSIGGGEKIKHTWFGGFAPFENPEISVTILVEEGESGGRTAAPIAGSLFKKYAQLRSLI